MGMKIEVVGKTWYTIDLSDEDVEKIRQYLKNHENEMKYYTKEKAIIRAIEALESDMEISLFDGEKETESDFMTDEINWSGFERRSAEEILGDIKNEANI